MNSAETPAAVYAGDGAEVGKWFSVNRSLVKFHLIGKRTQNAQYRWMDTNAACGVRFIPGFEFSARWAELGGRKCEKCEAKA